MKAQWKAADKSGATYAVMLGRAEAERNAVGREGSPLQLRAGGGAARQVAGWLQMQRDTEDDTSP